MDPVLQVVGLTVTLPSGRRVVDDVSFSVATGRSLALVGESGAGKSLTALAVMGLLPESMTTSGSILLETRRLERLDAEARRGLRNRRMSMILQNPMSAFDPVYTVGSHFRESLQAHRPGMDQQAVRSAALAALAETGFGEPAAILDLYPFQMSGGMLQRVMIALALLHDPALLIADEATTDLDVILQKQIVELLASRRRAMGLSLLLITHDLSVAAALADDIAVMRAGRLVESGPARDVFACPASPYTRELLRAHRDLYQSPLAAFGGSDHAA